MDLFKIAIIFASLLMIGVYVFIYFHSPTITITEISATKLPAIMIP